MVAYNIRTGVKKIKTKTTLAITAAALGASGLIMALIMPLAARAVVPNYTLTPWTYVGALGDCGTGYPAGTPGNVVSKWDYTTGNASPSLYLQKSAATTDCSSAGATVNGVSGITLTELNFDYKTGEYCGAGAPRFNVEATDGSHFMGGCSNGTKTDLGNGWTHVVIDPTNPAQAFPVLTAGATVNSIDIVFDEQGSTHIDNISVNDQIIGTPQTVKVTIDKYIDGTKATTTTANSSAFPMQSSWDADNIGAGSGTYTLSPAGFNSANPYEAVTSDMTQGADYSTNEVTGGVVVAATCTPGGAPYALAGYSTGNTLTEAQNAGPSATLPAFTDLQSDKFVIVWNTKCATTSTHPTAKDQCKNDGWKSLTDDNNRPFKNQGDCVSYVATHGKNKANG